MDHDAKVEAAKTAINNVFSDQSVSQSETARSLRSLVDEIDIMLDTLQQNDDDLDEDEDDG